MQVPEPNDELEAMLNGLPTREPSQMLDARIASMLQARKRSIMPRLAVTAAVLVAAGIALAMLINGPPTSPAENPAIVKGADPHRIESPTDAPPILTASNPVETLNLTWSRDVVQETRYTPTGQPYRAVVREAVDHKAWIDTKTGEIGQICVPREELIVMKQTAF